MVARDPSFSAMKDATGPAKVNCEHHTVSTVNTEYVSFFVPPKEPEAIAKRKFANTEQERILCVFRALTRVQYQVDKLGLGERLAPTNVGTSLPPNCGQMFNRTFTL